MKTMTPEQFCDLTGFSIVRIGERFAVGKITSKVSITMPKLIRDELYDLWERDDPTRKPERPHADFRMEIYAIAMSAEQAMNDALRQIQGAI